MFGSAQGSSAAGRRSSRRWRSRGLAGVRSTELLPSDYSEPALSRAPNRVGGDSRVRVCDREDG